MSKSTMGGCRISSARGRGRNIRKGERTASRLSSHEGWEEKEQHNESHHPDRCNNSEKEEKANMVIEVRKDNWQLTQWGGGKISQSDTKRRRENHTLSDVLKKANSQGKRQSDEPHY